MIIRRQYGPDGQVNEIRLPQVKDIFVACECEDWKRAKRQLAQSGIDEEFHRITFDDYKTAGKHPKFALARRAASEYVSVVERDYRARERRTEPQRTKYNGMLLCGEPGSGKTTLLFAAANELLKRRVPVLYFQHREEFNRIKDSGFHDAGEVYERLKRFRGLLIWDDLFKTKKRDRFGNRDIADWEMDATWDIINVRNQFDLPTAFSTEWLVSELMNLDRSTAGRIISRCTDPHDQARDRIVSFQLSEQEKQAGMKPITTFDHRFMRAGGE